MYLHVYLSPPLPPGHLSLVYKEGAHDTDVSYNETFRVIESGHHIAAESARKLVQEVTSKLVLASKFC